MTKSLLLYWYGPCTILCSVAFLRERQVGQGARRERQVGQGARRQRQVGQEARIRTATKFQAMMQIQQKYPQSVQPLLTLDTSVSGHEQKHVSVQCTPKVV